MAVNLLSNAQNMNFGTGYYKITQLPSTITPSDAREIQALSRIFNVGVQPMYDPKDSSKITEMIVDARDCSGTCAEGLVSTLKTMSKFAVEFFEENYPKNLNPKPRESMVPDIRIDLHG